MPKPDILFITPELRRVLDGLPEDAPRSRLEPFKPFILRWRRQGRSYRRIQQILQDECRVKVHHETLRKFLKLRSKPRKPQPEIDLEPQAIQPAGQRPAALTARNFDQSSDPYAEARERMRKHKEATAVRKSEPLFPVYTDDELLEPHVLTAKKKEEN